MSQSDDAKPLYICAEPGPYSTHCTSDPAHDYSHYDASDDSSWNDRSPEGWQEDVGHRCDDAQCPGLPGACRHCGRSPEADGDHTCPCPHRDGACPDHDPPDPGSIAECDRCGPLGIGDALEAALVHTREHPGHCVTALGVQP